MYLTDEKKLNFRINGLFYTRKWNDYVNYVYFENVFGGKSLLKNINKKSEELGLIFNSSMVNESEEKKWLDSGWFKKHNLLACETHLKDVQGGSLKPSKSINHKRLVTSDIAELIKVDGRIFEPYWKNSYSNFIETMKNLTGGNYTTGEIPAENQADRCDGWLGRHCRAGLAGCACCVCFYVMLFS